MTRLTGPSLLPRVPRARIEELFSVASSLAIPLSTLLVTPILLERVSESEYAVYLVSLSLARIAGALDFGVVGVALPRMTKLHQDDANAWGYFSTAMKRVSLTSVALSVFAALILQVLALEDLKFPMPGISLSLLVAACGVALSFQLMSLQISALYVTKSFGHLAWISVGASAAYYFSIAAITGIDSATGLLLVTTAQFLIVACVGALVSSRQLSRSDSQTRWSSVSSGSMQFVNVGGIAYSQIPTLVAGAMLNDLGIVAVGVGQQYGSIVRLASASFSGIVLSRLSSAAGSTNAIVLYRRMSRVWIPTCVLGGLLASVLAGPFLRFWLGSEVPAGAPIAAAFAAIASSSVASTLVVSSRMRTLERQRVEAVFVAGLLLSGATAVATSHFWPSATTVWATAAAGSLLTSLAFIVWSSRATRDQWLDTTLSKHSV